MTGRSLPTQQGTRAKVLAVIPCLNEAEHIEGVVRGLLAEADRVGLRIVVADGGSTDGTRGIVERLAEKDNRVVLLDNPKKIQSAALNLAVRTHGDASEFLIRIDAHADYPPHYCERLLATQAETGSDSVVVSMHTRGVSCFQRAAAAAQNSLLGNGGSAHRNSPRGRWVEHGHHALMRIAAFKAVEGYDESFSHNEDAELDNRLGEAGFRIFLMGGASITYYPRRSPIALFRQYFNIGRGRARNFLKHRRNTKPRHLVLVAIAPVILLLLLTPITPIFALPAFLWSLACLSFGAMLGIRARDACAIAAGIPAIVTQAGWSFGFFAGLIGASTKSDAAKRDKRRRLAAAAHAPDRSLR